jgi:plastocyanin
MTHLSRGGRIATGLSALAFWLAVGVAARAETLHVTMAAVSYAPREIVAHVGDVIEWSNEDIVVHSATDRAKSFDLTVLPKHQGRTTLKAAGKLSFYCKFHPNMTGEITVNP